MIKDDGCQYHPSCFTCPEKMCIFEYPGGPEAYFKHRELLEILDSGVDIKAAAERLSIQTQAVRRRYNKSVGISS